MKNFPKYRPTVFVSVDMYLAWYTLYLCILSKYYDSNHAVYLQVYLYTRACIRCIPVFQVFNDSMLQSIGNAWQNPPSDPSVGNPYAGVHDEGSISRVSLCSDLYVIKLVA